LKKNRNIKILLPIVIAIWGLLLYQMFDAFGKDNVPVAAIQTSVFKPSKIETKDAFSLDSIHSDPFLGTLYRKKTIGKNSRASKPIEQIQWPNVEYLGLVSGNTAASRIYILNINGQQRLLKRNDTLMNLRLMGGTQEHVTLRFKGKTQKFTKI